MYQQLLAIRFDQLRKGFLIARASGVQIRGFFEGHMCLMLAVMFIFLWKLVQNKNSVCL